MQQFKKTWKAKGALINKCDAISGVIWIIKTALNKIIQGIVAAALNVFGPFWVALCESTSNLGPLGDISNDNLSWGLTALQYGLDEMYKKYRDAGKKVLAGMSNHGLDWSLCLYSISFCANTLYIPFNSFLSYSGSKIFSMCSLILRTWFLQSFFLSVSLLHTCIRFLSMFLLYFFIHHSLFSCHFPC